MLYLLTEQYYSRRVGTSSATLPLKTAAEARAKAEQKQKILGILARKEDAALEAMDADKLRELIAAL